MAGDRNTAPGHRSRRTPLPPFASPGLPGGTAATQSSGARPSHASRPFWTPPVPLASGEPTAGPPAIPAAPVTPLPAREDWPSEAEWAGAGAADAGGEPETFPDTNPESAVVRGREPGPGGEWDAEPPWTTAPALQSATEFEAPAAPVVAEAPSLEDVDAEIESDSETGSDREKGSDGEKTSDGEKASQSAEAASVKETGVVAGAAMVLERLAGRIRDGSLSLPDGLGVGSDAALLAAVLAALLHERVAS